MAKNRALEAERDKKLALLEVGQVAFVAVCNRDWDGPYWFTSDYGSDVLPVERQEDGQLVVTYPSDAEDAYWSVAKRLCHPEIVGRSPKAERHRLMFALQTRAGKEIIPPDFITEVVELL